MVSEFEPVLPDPPLELPLSLEPQAATPNAKGRDKAARSCQSTCTQESLLKDASKTRQHRGPGGGRTPGGGPERRCGRTRGARYEDVRRGRYRSVMRDDQRHQDDHDGDQEGVDGLGAGGPQDDPDGEAGGGGEDEAHVAANPSGGPRRTRPTRSRTASAADRASGASAAARTRRLPTITPSAPAAAASARLLGRRDPEARGRRARRCAARARATTSAKASASAARSPVVPVTETV